MTINDVGVSCNNFVSGLRTLKPKFLKKLLKNLKNLGFFPAMTLTVH